MESVVVQAVVFLALVGILALLEDPKPIIATGVLLVAGVLAASLRTVGGWLGSSLLHELALPLGGVVALGAVGVVLYGLYERARNHLLERDGAG